MMPVADGVEVCRRVRNEVKEPYTYIILLTALQRDEDLVTGMEAGADDYITKPFKANELKVRLRAGRRIIDLHNDLIEAREALREKAAHNPLTGLWNHEEFLIVLPGCGREGVAAIAESLRHCIGSESMDIPEGMIQVTISLGLSIKDKGRKRDVNSLVQAADQALYRAKQGGRNPVEVAPGSGEKAVSLVSRELTDVSPGIKDRS
jgi:PleD family two-component response regulator